MNPVVRIYWIFTLILLPLSLLWLILSVGSSFSLAAILSQPLPLTAVLIFAGWEIIGGYEMAYSASNLRKNYPVLANIRYGFEFIRPEIQQYFIANNTEEKPFSRERRNLVYRRAKGADDTLPFGTEHDILAEGYRSSLHSIRATEVKTEFERVTFGGPACLKPYSASSMNIS